MKKDNLIINISISILIAVGFFFIYKTSADVLNSEPKPKSIALSTHVELYPMIVDSKANSMPPLQNLENVHTNKNSKDSKNSEDSKKVVENSFELDIEDDITQSKLEGDITRGASQSSDDMIIETTVTTITTSIGHFIDNSISDLEQLVDFNKPLPTTIRAAAPVVITPLNNTGKGILKKTDDDKKTPIVVAEVSIPIKNTVIPIASEGISANSDELIYISGRAIDGYLKNAIVCLDLNGDGYCQVAQEPTANTDQNGSYKLVITKTHRDHKDFDKAMIIVFDGIDVDTGKRFEGKMISVNSGENDIVNLSPITTLVAQKVKLAIHKNKNISSAQIQEEIIDAQKKVARVLDIDEKDTGEDPVQLHEEGNSDLLQKSLQLQKSVETLVITAKKNSFLDSATLSENIYEALAGSLDHVDKSSLDLNKENEDVLQSPKSKNDTGKKPIVIVENPSDSNDGISRLLEKTQNVASENIEVKELLGGEESIEMISVAQQMSENVKIAFEEVESDPEEERHIIALSIRQDLQEVEKSLDQVVDIDQISEQIVITPNDNRFEDKDWEKKYIEDDLKSIGEPCVDILVFKIKDLLLSEHETIKPGILLEGSDALLSASDDVDIQRVYALVLKNRSKDLESKNSLLNASLEVSVNLIEKDNEEDSELSTLAKLLFNGLYYAVQENNRNLLEVSFDLPSLGEVSVEELSGEQRVVTSLYSVVDNHLRVPINNYDFIFVSQEEDYLLFEDGRRMYTSFEKAKEFIDSFLSDEEQISVDLSDVLKNGLYYAVEEGRADLLEISFDDPDEGMITIQELSGDQRIATVPYIIENNQVTTPINEYIFTFIKHEGNYLLFEDGRRMYYSEEDARNFIEELNTPLF